MKTVKLKSWKLRLNILESIVQTAKQWNYNKQERKQVRLRHNWPGTLAMSIPALYFVHMIPVMLNN